jgi:non-ribosomal peptide synthetase component E (peptide arylation enzyme)
MLETLFTGPTTAHGYYKVRANNIRLFNGNGTPFLITEETPLDNTVQNPIQTP